MNKYVDITESYKNVLTDVKGHTWTVEVDNLARKIHSQAPYELKLYGGGVKEYTDQFKPILY